MNFTSREMRVGEMLMGNRSVSFFCRLLLWRFTKISKYDTKHSFVYDLLSLISGDFKVTC